MNRGAFIVIEGIDGSGTTTQTALLEKRLTASGRAVVSTREPTAGPVGSMIRQVLTKRLREPSGAPFNASTMALLFAADRVDHGAVLITPALASGAVVISDRYDHSSVGYQGLTGKLPFAEAAFWLRAINTRAVRPDLVVVVDIDPREAENRRRARGGAEELYEVAALQAHLCTYYSNLSKYFPEDTIVHVDGSRGTDDVGAAIDRAVQALFFRQLEQRKAGELEEQLEELLEDNRAPKP